MIQRKQTLFLLAVFIIAIVMIFIPFQILLTGGEKPHRKGQSGLRSMPGAF